MTQFKVLFTILISSLFISSAYSASIENIQALDNQTIKIAASSDVIFSDVKVYWEVSVLKDIQVVSSTKDSVNPKKMRLTLANDLTLNSSYNLIWIMWAEWNIDFTIWDKFIGETINPNYYNEEKIIEKISIVDSKTLEIVYNYDLTTWLYEFKLLGELSVDSMNSKGDNVLNIELSSKLDKSSSYKIMISSLENIDGKEINLTSNIYDFTTNSNLVEKSTSSQAVEQVVSQVVTNAEPSVEDIALNAAETPDSGAETWFVMLLTFIVSTFYFTRNRFKKS